MLTALILVVLGLLLWIITLRDFKEEDHQHFLDVRDAQQSLLHKLAANRDFFLLLTEQMVEGRLDAETFQHKAARYVADNPELINITWADHDFIIRWTAPYEPNKQVLGLKLSLAEPERASRLARQTGQPAYTRPFKVIQGIVAVEIYVPVFREGDFLGTFGGIYSLEGLLRNGISEEIRERNQACLVDDSGSVVGTCVAGPGERTDPRLTQVLPLGADVPDLGLRLARYRNGWAWDLWLLSVLSFALAVGVGWSMWALRRYLRAQEQAEQALYDNYTLLNSILEGTNNAIFVKDLDGRYLLVNAAGARMLGASAEAIVGQDDRGVLPPEAAARIMELDRQVMASGEGQAVDLEIEVDGVLHTYLSSKNPFRDRQGRIIGLIGVARDISARKRAEEVLKESEAKYRLLFRAVTDGLIIFDAETRKVLEANEAACRLYGYTSEKFSQLSVYDLSAEPERSKQRIDAMLATGLVRVSPVYHKTSDGTILTLEISSGSFTWNEQRLFFAVIRDIAEQQKLDQMKDDMLSAVSHEMRTPLTAMLGFAEFMLENPVEPDQLKEYLGIICKETGRLKELIDNLLDLQRLRAGFGMSDLQPVDIGELLRELGTFFARQSSLHQLSWDAPQTSAVLLGNRELLHQALSNLLSNAIRYSPEGGLISLSARVEVEEGQVVFSVQDQGQGIPPESRKQIFSRFFRIDNRDGTRVGGSGLGLPLVKEIAEAHAGRVWVESEEGVGSTFYMSIPLRPKLPQKVKAGS